jgi:S1-C subfamily serine protease
VLKIDLKNLPAITIGRSDNIRIGDVRWPSATRSASARP